MNVAPKALCALSFALAIALWSCDAELGAGRTQDSGQADANWTSVAPSEEDGCTGQFSTLWYLDDDGDGFGVTSQVVRACEPPPGYVGKSGDCDDLSPAMHPGADEVCGDYIDNDCFMGDPCLQAMLAHWDFQQSADDITADASGNGHSATLLDGVLRNEGGSIVLDGIDDHALVQHDDDFELRSGTITLWVLSHDTGTRQGLWSKDSSGFDSGGHLQIEMREDGSVQARLQSPTESYFVNSDPIDRALWHHVAFSFGPAGMRLSVDGFAVASSVYDGGMENNREPIALGASTSVSDDNLITPISNPMLGELADIRVFSRALSQQEIGELVSLSRRVP